MADNLEREFICEPGYDCIQFECGNGSKRCVPGGGGSHGRHGLTMRWLLKGEKGAVQFVLYSGWMPEPEEFSAEMVHEPMPSDLGYHSLEPQYDGQTQMDCGYLPGGKCYYDGSSLNAYEPFRVLCNEGGEALWSFLETYYRARFEGGEYPEKKPYRLARRER